MKAPNKIGDTNSTDDDAAGKASEVYCVPTVSHSEKAGGNHFLQPTDLHLSVDNPSTTTAEHLKGSRFHIKTSKKNFEEFKFDEQFMIDAIAEHYRQRKRHVLAKKTIFKFLNNPSTVSAYAYHAFTFMLCIVTIALSMVYCVEGFQQNPTALAVYMAMESLLALLFLGELVLHVWCSDVHLKYKKNGRLSYLYTAPAVIDIFAIVCFVVKLIFVLWAKDQVPSTLNFKLIIGFQTLQIFKLLHYERYNKTLQIMVAIAWRHRKEILSAYLLIIYLTTFISFLFYLFEYESIKAKLVSLPDSFYFSVISFTTIGYGDIHPTTYGGKILITISSFLGLALVAVPSGVIGSGFALQLAHEEKKKRVQNRRLPAILLIQNAWRRHSIVTRGRRSTCFKELYIKLTTHGGSIIQNQPLDTETEDEKSSIIQKHSTVNPGKKSNFVVENYNPADNSATVTIYNGSKAKQCLTYIKIADHISNTKAYLKVFWFLAEVKLNVALKNFSRSRKQDPTLETVVTRIYRQNIEITHQLNTLSENFKKAFNKSHCSLPMPPYTAFSAPSKVKRAGKVDSVVNLNSNIVALDNRLNRIESTLKHLTDRINDKNHN